MTEKRKKKEGLSSAQLPEGVSVIGGPEGDGLVLAAKSADVFRQIGGSENRDFNSVLLREVLATIWVPGGESDGEARRIAAVCAALQAFKPKDEIESMIAGQCAAMHFGAMECFRRAMLPAQPFDVAARLRRDGANLARAMTEMLDALDRKRGKSPQILRVERVVVQDGGQAVVGNIQAVAPSPAAAPDPGPGPVPAPAPSPDPETDTFDLACLKDIQLPDINLPDFNLHALDDAPRPRQDGGRGAGRARR